MTDALEFFDPNTKEEIDLKNIGTLFRQSNGFWRATIRGGWHVGYGKSKKAAINDSVRQRDEKEQP